MSRYDHSLRLACRRAREWYAAKARAYHESDADLDDSTPAHPAALIALAVFILAGLAWSGWWLSH